MTGTRRIQIRGPNVIRCLVAVLTIAIWGQSNQCWAQEREISERQSHQETINQQIKIVDDRASSERDKSFLRESLRFTQEQLRDTQENLVRLQESQTKLVERLVERQLTQSMKNADGLRDVNAAWTSRMSQLQDRHERQLAECEGEPAGLTIGSQARRWDVLSGIAGAVIMGVAAVSVPFISHRLRKRSKSESVAENADLI